MDYSVQQYRSWLDQNMVLSNAFSVDALKSLTIHLLLGKNYRLLTENNTKSKLMFTYLWLKDVTENAKKEYGDSWKEDLLNDLLATKKRTQEQDQLIYWLLGLTYKTSVNLGISKEQMPQALQNLIEHMNTLFSSVGKQESLDDAWLLMMSGSATLNIRGSDKSKIGKHLEKVLIRSSLKILGFEEDVNFWTNIQRDNEVDRETDAEIETKRTKIRVEVGLISTGNQEVTEDKVRRVDRNGIILFDAVGKKTNIYQTAEKHGVKLIQIRNNQPLVELYRHLKPLVKIELNEPPVLEKDIESAVRDLPDNIFMFKNDKIIKH